MIFLKSHRSQTSWANFTTHETPLKFAPHLATCKLSLLLLFPFETTCLSCQTVLNMGKADEALQATPAEDPAPPPYSEATQGSSGQAGPSEGPAPPHAATSVYRPFPQITSAYYQWKMTLTFHLGESADQRLYAVSTYPGWSSKENPGIILHNGPTKEDPMLATAGEHPGWNVFSPNSMITLPPLAGDSSQERRTEAMRASVSGKAVHFRFSIEVGDGEGGAGLRREEFVWQTCKGEEAKGLVEAPWQCGFKLTRASDQQSGGGSSGGGTKEAAAGEGQEVLAIFAWNRGWSITNPFRVQFVAPRGVMGERWELMVIITGLRLW